MRILLPQTELVANRMRLPLKRASSSASPFQKLRTIRFLLAEFEGKLKLQKQFRPIC
jgi:hypothetical protein